MARGELAFLKGLLEVGRQLRELQATINIRGGTSDFGSDRFHGAIPEEEAIEPLNNECEAPSLRTGSRDPTLGSEIIDSTLTVDCDTSLLSRAGYSPVSSLL